MPAPSASALLAGVAAAVPDDGRWTSVARWAQRLVGAVAAAACVLLVISGVLAI